MSMRWTLNLSLYVSVITNYIASLTTEYLISCLGKEKNDAVTLLYVYTLQVLAYFTRHN